MALGMEEWLVIIIVALVFFGGGTQIPKLARAMGRARGEFQKSKMEFETEMRASQAASSPGASSAPPASGPTEQQLRATARSLGIDDAGKDTAELKRLIAQRLA